MKITIKNQDTNEITTISRDVATTHPAWVHEQLGTESEGELQDCLSQFNLSDFYRGENHLGRDQFGLEMIAEESDWSYRISDGNAKEKATTLAEAAEIAEDWYEFLKDDGKLDEIPACELDSTSLAALNNSIAKWEKDIAEAMGLQAFAGHGNYYVSAADRAGLSLVVTKVI